jgi:hypothetical protein
MNILIIPVKENVRFSETNGLFEGYRKKRGTIVS